MIHIPAALMAAVLSASVDDVATKVQEVYEKAQSYKAHFVQEVTLKTIDKTEKDEGSVCFKKPGKMRWEYRKSPEQPLLQLIVSDGETMWFYTPSEKQVLVDKIERFLSSKTAMDFLSGLGNLKEEFKVKFSKAKGLVDRGKYYLLELRPKELPKGTGGKYLAAVSKATFMVDQTFSYDEFGNRTRIIFDNVEINTDLPDDLFKFEIPKGAEVVNPPKQ